MDDDYRDIHKQADRLRYRFKDVVRGGNADDLRSLERMTKQLLDDIEMSKSPRSLEARVKEIQEELQDMKSRGDETLNPQEADDLHDEYQDLREEIRELPNY